jgi:hypothetical protein
VELALAVELCTLDGEPIVQLYGCECDSADEGDSPCAVAQCLMDRDLALVHWTGHHDPELHGYVGPWPL